MNVIGMSRTNLVAALRLHRGVILEADEWRPMADHVFGLIDLACRECVDLLRPEYPDAVATLQRRMAELTPKRRS